MSLRMDPELVLAMAPMAEALASRPRLPPGDVAGRRKAAAEVFANMSSMFPDISEVSRKDHKVPSTDGYEIIVSEFWVTDVPTVKPSKALYYIHGGGMIMGSVDIFQTMIKERVRETGVPTFAVQYRLAPEAQHPVPVNDCYTGLQWLSQNAPSLGVDPAHIILMGESAGGGLAAATALMARDKKLNPPLCKQILIFPMLDDRNNKPLPEIENLAKASWSVNDNITGWTALIGEKAGGPDVSEYAAPARAESLAGLPPTYIECGQLDIFVYEDMKYANRLLEAQVPLELHIYPGQPHGFQMFGAKATYAKMSKANAVNAIKNA